MAARYADEVNKFLNQWDVVEDEATALDEDDLQELDEANDLVN
jgi:hypothetical protein